MLVPLSTVVSPSAAAPPAERRAPGYTVRTLHFAVTVGPNDDQRCDVVGDLYLPRGASRRHRVPAILTTNGFGGSKDDQAGMGKAFARRGYAVLSYSGLGFGGSSCAITLDDRAHDGKAGRALVSYLGGARGIAFLDAAHTEPAPRLQAIRRDRRDHRGRRSRHDPRVGMIGGSYGGGAQFATAAVDPRVDTIVPMITWNDLSYSLAPNGTDQVAPGTVSTRTPGAAKLVWALGFSLLGMTGDLANQQPAPEVLPCPNFAGFVCPALVTAGLTGALRPAHVQALRSASVASYLRRIRVPVLLMQGQHDTLFNLNEAEATYRALQRQGTEVKMIWHSWGHSGGTVPGEIDLANPRPRQQYESGRVLRWFDRHLKGRKVGTGPEFAYFRDWVRYRGNARPAYATAARFPVGQQRRYRLSGDRALRTGAITEGRQSFLTPVAGLPTGLNEVDVLGSVVGSFSDGVTDLPGSYAAWTTPRLGRPTDVVGSPVVRVKVNAPTAALTEGVDAAGKLVLFVKVVDVAPDGTARMINAMETPVRVPDVDRPFTVRLPGIVHRFATGHRIRLMIGGGSINYRGGMVPTPVTIAAGPHQTLRLPVVR
ncbi:prolyl oligopeptidase family serine peptidase [Nocardioides sp. BGMRC 2183]|nr:prolyl oligopeptidase family serine peptidase [Nocardioides sp. BGMRC 2183]